MSPGTIDRRALGVFRAGGRDFSVGDVLLTIARANAEASSATAAVDDAGIKAAVEAWRYQRDLISGEECEAWLARRGLDYSDLQAALARRLGGALATNDGEAVVDALVDEFFDEHARELSRHVALALDLGLPWPEPQTLASCLAAWQTAALGLDLPLAERQRELATHTAELTLLHYTQVEFDSDAALREARMCVLEDRVPLVEVAAAAGYPHRVVAARAGALPELVTRALQHAAPGQLCSTADDHSQFLLLQLDRREAPTLDDAAVALLVEARLRRGRLDALVSRHVHWIWPLNHA